MIGDEHAHRVSAREDTLDEQREVELAGALAALAHRSPTAVDHHWLDGLTGPSSRAWPRYRDSGMVVLPGGRAAVPPDVRPDCFAVADLDEAASRLAGLIARRRPHVVLTYGPHGGYGHPDHVMAHRVVMRALVSADADWTVPYVYGAAGDASQLRSWSRAHPTAGWDLDGPLPHMFVEPDLIDVTIRGEPWLPAKIAALRALPTQVTVLDDRPGHAVFELSNGIAQPLTGTEHLQLLRPVPARVVVDERSGHGPVDPIEGLLLPPGTAPTSTNG